MPVQTCSEDGKPGYQYGDEGKCYTYTAGDEQQRTEAKRKAHVQGVAVKSNLDEEYQ